MGQKVNPIGFRIAVNKDWRSRWYANKKEFGDMLHEDLMIRDFVKKQLRQAAVSRIQIERFANRVRITVQSARPGMVFGRKRAEYDTLKDKLFKMTGGKDIYIDVVEIKQPELRGRSGSISWGGEIYTMRRRFWWALWIHRLDEGNLLGSRQRWSGRALCMPRLQRQIY